MPHAPIVLTPEHLCDPALAIAAVRAGGLGLLDLGFSAPHEVRRRALAQLARFSGPDRERWGARWNTWGLAGRMPEVLEGLVDRRLPFLLVAGAPADRAADVLRQGRRLAARVLLEVYDGAGARAAAAHGFDGIVLAGNEAGGRVGRASAFLLLQGVREGLDVPFWIRGAFGPETAAAALLAGAEGVALAEELWLAREAPFDAADRARFTALDGSETLCLGEGHERVRLFAQADRAGLRDLAQHGGEAGAPWREALLARWREAPPGGGGPLPLGQGVGLAADLARRYGTVGRILEAFATTARHHLEIAPGQRALAPDAPLAAEIGIRTPIVQGPMTRVSDTPAFALAVAEHGALPFLALALLRGAEAKRLLVATRRALGDRPWGVGLLGFIPAALRDEQMQAISEVGPGFGI
ncbi:MAG: nitronate monooxygenase, partial [Planctomycetota bacterium]